MAWSGWPALRDAWPRADQRWASSWRWEAKERKRNKVMRKRTTVTSTRLRKVRESRRINLRFMLVMLEYSSVCTVILQCKKLAGSPGLFRLSFSLWI